MAQFRERAERAAESAVGAPEAQPAGTRSSSGTLWRGQGVKVGKVCRGRLEPITFEQASDRQNNLNNLERHPLAPELPHD